MTTNPWNEWEDWHAGMFVTGWSAGTVEASRSLLADVDWFREVATEMVRAWPHAAQHNIVHLWTGRNAWIGQASCLYAHDAPAGATREAWGQLSNTEQRAANGTADTVRELWGREQRHAETLFVF